MQTLAKQVLEHAAGVTEGTVGDLAAFRLDEAAGRFDPVAIVMLA